VKKVRFPWKLAVVLVCATLAQGKANPTATANYEKALQNLKSGDFKIDFKALRFNCAASKYECEADPDDTKALFSLLNDKKFDEALKKVNKSLEKVFVDAELHYIAFIANSESGNKEKAEFHKAVIRGLLDSIQQDKHGRSEEDAFVVINVHEELVPLAHTDAVAELEDRRFIIGLDSETDHLPVGEVRNLWAPAALKEKDVAIARAEESCRADFLETCRRIVTRNNATQ
jgi:hypothetical protein